MRMLAVLALVLWFQQAHAGLAPQVDAAITARVEEELRETGAPGAAVAILRDGEIVYLKGFGRTSVEEDGHPVTPDTLFRLGSTTKMMTALVALDDAAAGRLDLDAPLRTYVKDLHPAIGKVTLRQLLTHTAGLAEGKPSVESHDDAALGKMVLEWGKDAMFAPAGDVFSYTSPGYWLAGYVLERVHGKPYAEVMRERLFEPLGMPRSTLRPLEAITHPLAQGHEDQGADLKVVRPMAENTAQYPAGSVFSTARELAAFAAVLLNGGRSEGRQVLSPPAVHAFFTANVALPGGDGALYGFGLVSYPLAGTPVFEHGGVRRGYGSHLRFFPEKRGAIVLLTNRNGVTLGNTRETITASVFGLTEPPPPEVPAAPVTAAEARRYTGTYAHKDLARATVLWDGRQLVLETEGKQPLTRARGDTFRTAEGEEVTFVFRPGEERARYLHRDLLSSVRTGG
ncbi:MAG TPA: serine hydrolase domain-containing protein [Candidatus Polarisedimenticolaceae bacterium]|nr:serine hydrolase domain-containing protein [Candidatus Polarisedimenticolaceae bacterium]